MKTPLPTASTAMAVTNRRCGPIDGNPSLLSTRQLWEFKPG